MRAFLLLFACGVLISHHLIADTTYIKVHFIYGSKPKREFKTTEHKWFGGIHGGHVGIEVDSNYIIDFKPDGDFHIFDHPRNRHSRFATHTVSSFWQNFGTDSNQVKRSTIIIPITSAQKKKLDSIAEVYTTSSPYDYAFIGMRCGAAAYDVLAQIGVMKERSHCGTYLRIFYPKMLRKRLIRKAEQKGWTIHRVEGPATRRWESD